jgi:hypothetical protein
MFKDMAEGPSFSPLTDELAAERDQGLEALEEKIEKLFPGEKVDYDDRTLKPIQQVLGVDPAPDLVKQAEIGLAQVLAREFDLDWVTVEGDDGPELGLNVPMTENAFSLSSIYAKSLGAGKSANLRITYMEWCDWIEEHRFD